MAKAKRDNPVPPTPPPLPVTPATAYVPFAVSDFQQPDTGRWRAAGVPLPSDHVERIEVLVTLKPGVRLMNVGRSCAHVAVDLAIASADEKSAAE